MFCSQSDDGSSRSDSHMPISNGISIPSGDSGPGDNSSDDDDDPDNDPDPTDPEYTLSDDESSEEEPFSKNSVPVPLLKEVAKIEASYRICEELLKVGVKITDDVPQHSLSKASLWSKIVKIRHDKRTNLMEELTSSNGQIVVQFDGKTCHKLNQRHVGREERLIVLCHTERYDVPLGFFILDSHSGLDCARKVADAITMNELENKIVGVVCDTENVNTGIHNGAVHLLENMLDREVLRLMCRHHVFEIVLKDVFISIFGASTGSKDTTFQFLNENWESIKRYRFIYEPVNEEELSPMLQRLSENSKHILSRHTAYFRNDYAELIDLSLKFLGVNTGKDFHVPGATNNARWMFRAIYALKTFLFRDHFDFDQDFLRKVQRFCMFVTLIYVKFWNQCSNAVDAPYNDIQFLKEIDAYKQVDSAIAEVACTVIKRHLWYLSDELIVLALLSSKVSVNDKNEMRTILNHNVGRRTQNSLRHTDEIRDLQNLQLRSFISERSFFLFDLLEINVNFLLEDANDWEDIESYRVANEKVTKLITVVNDGAERALQIEAQAIDEQRVQSETRLQDFIVSSYDG